MPSFNVGTNQNELQVYIPGEYEINFMIRIAPVEVPDQTVSAGVRQDGNFIDSTLQYSILSTTENTILQGSVIEFLSGQVDLAFYSTGVAAFDLTLRTNATLTIERISPQPAVKGILRMLRIRRAAPPRSVGLHRSLFACPPDRLI